MDKQLRDRLEKLKSSDPSELADSERKEILALFHRAENEFPLKDELFQQLVDFKDVIEEDEVLRSGFERLWSRIEDEKIKQEKGKVIRMTVSWYWVAAVLVIGLILGSLIPFGEKDYSNPVCYTAIAPIGSVSEAILPDSTVVFLNAGSKARYFASPEKKLREVYLEGEAWFQVTKSKKVPFIVHTPYYNVRVTGTEFNVKAYVEDPDAITTLGKGCIHIEAVNGVEMDKDIVMKPGDQLIYNKEKKTLLLNKVNPQIYSSWKDNKLIFIDMSLRELVILLERRYGVNIDVVDKSILNYHYDGTIKNETIIEVMKILQNTLPIEYTINDQTIRILKK